MRCGDVESPGPPGLSEDEEARECDGRTTSRRSLLTVERRSWAW